MLPNQFTAKSQSKIPVAIGTPTKSDSRSSAHISSRTSPKTSRKGSERPSRQSSKSPSRVPSPFRLTPRNPTNKKEHETPDFLHSYLDSDLLTKCKTKDESYRSFKKIVDKVKGANRLQSIREASPVQLFPSKRKGLEQKSEPKFEDNAGLPLVPLVPVVHDHIKLIEAEPLPCTSKDSPISFLNHRLLKRIFSFVNHSDLLVCREVQKHWNKLITSDPSFLERTCYVVAIQKVYNSSLRSISHFDLTSQANLEFRHARFQNIDNGFLADPEAFVYQNSDNEKYFPKSEFLRPLISIEFFNCFLYWHTVKRFLVNAASVESLIITNCHISDDLPPTRSDEFEMCNAGFAVFSLKSLQIFEVRHIKGITTILKKFVGYKNSNLVTLKITYHPPEDPKAKFEEDVKEDCAEFCSELKKLLTLSKSSLQKLILDIHHEATLDFIGESISKVLALLGSRMNLKEFQITSSLGCWVGKPGSAPKSNVEIKMETIFKSPQEQQESAVEVTRALARFLETQKNIEKLTIPCIAYPVMFTEDFSFNFARLPCAKKLEYLAVPSAGFLHPEFLFHFPNLTKIKVGGSCGADYSSGWEIFRSYLWKKQSSKVALAPSESQSNGNFELPLVDDKQENNESLVPFQTTSYGIMSRIQDLCISTSIIPDNFSLLVKNLTGLTSLEISSGKPVVSDQDLQACIKHLKHLKSLAIGCSENITDYGITGIPADLCMLTFKTQFHIIKGLNPNIWKSPKILGRPLSDLKGLRKLALMGDSKITDVGIGYGIAFPELKYCHLPYSDCIWEWGIEKFGEVNPSVETLILSGVNQFSKEALLKLRKTHRRMKQGDSYRSGYFVERVSPLQNDFSLVLPPPNESLKHAVESVALQLASLVCAIGPTKIEDELMLT